MTTRTHLTAFSAMAAAAALTVLGAATAQTSGNEPATATEPMIEMQLVTTADTAAPAAPMAAPMAEPMAEPLPQRIVIIADPEPVAEPAGLTAQLDRAGVQAEFLAMRDAAVLVPANEAGDTESTAQRRLDYHQAQADAWTGYQLKLAEVRLARELAWAQQALEEQARQQSATQPTPAVAPPVEAPPATTGN